VHLSLLFLSSSLPLPRQNLERQYPVVGAHGLQLIRAMLRFNPADRITAEDALEHPYFDDIKKKGYINTYRANNQHLFSESDSLSSALNPIPLNANLEKIGESSEHLRQNVSPLPSLPPLSAHPLPLPLLLPSSAQIIQEVLFYRNRDRMEKN
jgi:serine/threonine protein kinase